MLKTQVIGYIGQDATVSEINPENMAIKFSVAHTYKDKTVWVDCTLFRKPGNTAVAQYLKKGTQVYVEGVPSVYAYTSQSGEVCGKLQLIATEVQLLCSKNANSEPASQPQSTAQPTAQPQQISTDDDDPPF